jgi:hypoxanthine phosphoribosyltransferase
VEYDPFTDEAIEKLSDAIRDAQTAPSGHSDSLVYEVFPHITVDITSSPDAPMPWSLYWGRFKSVTERLREAKALDLYRPDILVGITNGGAIFADLLERDVEYTCPITSLWAKREAVKYFENPINAGVLAGIKESVKQKSSNEVRLLLLDDIVARGNTFRQAYGFIKEYAPEWHVRFLPLMYKEERNYRTLVTGGPNEQPLNRILWKHPKFDLADETIHEMHMVKWRTLPYEKEIAS